MEMSFPSDVEVRVAELDLHCVTLLLSTLCDVAINADAIQTHETGVSPDVKLFFLFGEDGTIARVLLVCRKIERANDDEASDHHRRIQFSFILMQLSERTVL
jgi:hypothetical protein